MRLAWLGVLAGGAILVGVALLAAAPAAPRTDVGSLAALDATVEWEPAPRARRQRVPAVPSRSARIGALERRARRRPLRVVVPSIGVRARVVSAGVRRRGRELVLPRRPERVAWYRHGPRPGEPGTAILAAHADYDDRPAAFLRLQRVEPGAMIRVRMRRGGTRRFRVVARRRYGKGQLPGRLFRRHGPRVLALITCGGRFDADTRTYDSNTVVYAVLKV